MTVRPAILIVLLLPGVISAQRVSKTPPGSDAGGSKTIQTGPAKTKQEIEDERKQKREQALRILQRSHALNEQLVLSERVQILNRQILLASRLDRQLGRDWSVESLDLIRQLSDLDEQAKAQGAVVAALSANDPDYALDLFRSFPAPSAGNMVDARQIAAARLFPVLAGRGGDSGFEVVHQEAIRLGAEDAYPYGVMATVAMQSSRGRPRQNKERVSNPRAQQILQEATEYYARSRRSLFGDLSFADMLQRGLVGVTDEVYRASLTLIANNLLVSAEEWDSRPRPTSENSTSVKLNPADQTLRRLYETITKYDQELAARVKLARPSVAETMGAVNPPNNVAQNMNNDFSLSRIRRAMRNDPNQALSMAQGLTDQATRAQALSVVAGGVASQDPEKAKQILEQADALAANIEDTKSALRIVITQADVAARSKNSGLLRQCLEKGFSLGDRLIRDDQDENPGHVTAWSSLTGLVRVGYAMEPELVVSYIDSLSVPVAKANLLLIAAQNESANALRVQRVNPAIRQE